MLFTNTTATKIFEREFFWQYFWDESDYFVPLQRKAN